MEADNTADKAASLDFRSKMALFESIIKSQQSSKTNSDHARNGRPKPMPKVLPKRRISIQETIRQGNERATSPQMISKESLKERLPRAERSFRDSFAHELLAKTDEVSIRRSSEWSPNDMQVFRKPLCLVRTDETNTLTIESETIEQIQKIDWPMVIVSVAGLYRTGKSYLMNRLAGSTKGFALGGTIESTTKGIWAWCKIHPKMPNTVLLLLDTEGLVDVEKGDPNHDNKLFTLATLLSNCLVYNMKGAFDQDAVNKLTDFSLKLSKGGKEITEDEYLERSLGEQKGKEDIFNKPRECIREYFKVRKCFTLPVPGDGEVLENLEILQFKDLSEKFKEATYRFVSYVYSKKPKTLLTSKPVNGQMFAILTNNYVADIGRGAIPDVDDAFLAVAKIENKRIGHEAVEIFSTQMEKVGFPVSGAKLENYYAKAQQMALAQLREQVVHEKDGHYETQAQMKMDAIWNTMKEENSKQIRDMCDVKLQEAYTKSLKGNIRNRVYEVAGGYRRFQRDIEILKEEYASILRDFEEHEILWSWLGFVKTLKETESKIIQSDEALSQKEKEDEKNRNEEKNKSILKDQQDVQKEVLEEQKKEMEKHYKELEKAREKQAQEDKEKYEALIAERLKEQEAQKELERFKKEHEERLKKDKEQAENELARLRKAQEERMKKDKEQAEKELAKMKKAREERISRWIGARVLNAITNK